MKAGVHFEKIDVLSAEPVGDDQYDMIVSNPPYVTESEKNEMEPNVLDWEPGLALLCRTMIRCAFIGVSHL